MIISIHNSLVRVRRGKRLGTGLAIGIVLRSAVVGEVGQFVNDGSCLGIGAGGWGVPENVTKIDVGGVTGVRIRVGICLITGRAIVSDAAWIAVQVVVVAQHSRVVR